MNKKNDKKNQPQKEIKKRPNFRSNKQKYNILQFYHNSH